MVPVPTRGFQERRKHEWLEVSCDAQEDTKVDRPGAWWVFSRVRAGPYGYSPNAPTAAW